MKVIIVVAAISLLAGCAGMRTQGTSGGSGTGTSSSGAGSSWEQQFHEDEKIFHSYIN